LAQAQLFKSEQLWEQLSGVVLSWYQQHPQETSTVFAIANNLTSSDSSQAQKIGEEIFRVMLQNEPNNTNSMTALAMLLHNTGRLEESAQLYQHALELKPDNLLAVNNLAWILCEEKGQPQQALELAQRGLEKDPNYIDLIDTRGVAYYRLGEFDKAAQDFDRCVSLYLPQLPARTSSYFHLARALAKLGQKSTAIESLNKTLESNDKVGGLSAAEFSETKRLLEELSEGGR
jgi:tetratricopeptide (TPR) repeat protein